MDNEILIRIDEHVKDIYVDIKEIKKTLFGTGKDGLCVRVDRIEQNKINAQQESDLSWKKIGGITIIISVVFTIVSFFLNKLRF